MIYVTAPLIAACKNYHESAAANLWAGEPADVLLAVCEAALKAKGPQSREWWRSELIISGLVAHLTTAKILLDYEDGLLFCPEGFDAKLISGGASVEWFDEFWKEYLPGPGLSSKSKGARQAALKAWGKIKTMDRKLFDRIVKAVKSEVASGWSGSNGHNPHAATWLNQKRWEDVEASPDAPGSTAAGDLTRQAREDALLQKMRKMLPPEQGKGA